ncbi:hypothetical protein H0A61_02153 [Koleobacter methoxysyntrophicus]|uniref:Uncharacterized protein n=1 Tax=Koleobacter methoxysyntrophicus TaxID=2751313 RepID=A0A8A0RPD9_9FIRM|nr:hypothetical protein H0A61_02153 [Koleobacter methoxysyntrophicus]
MYEIVKKLGIMPKKIVCYIWRGFLKLVLSVGKFMWLTGNILENVMIVKMDLEMSVENAKFRRKIKNNT